MANQFAADLNNTGDHHVDCGVLGFYRYENFTSTAGVAVQDGISIPIAGNAVIPGWCVGDTVFSGTNSSGVYAVGWKIDLPIAEALMGLAGIICALLIVKAFIRS